MTYRLSIFFIIGIALSLAFLNPSIASANNLKVHFIDVGQGDAIFIEKSDGGNILIDCGDSSDDAGEKVEAYLNLLKVDKIDTFILTHPHDDHYGGLFYLIEKKTIGEFLYGTKVTTTKYVSLEKKLSDHSIPIQHIGKGYTISFGSLGKMVALAAGPHEVRGIVTTTDIPDVDLLRRVNQGALDRYADLNECSIVMKLTYGKTSFLFTGDATSSVEKELLEENVNLKSTIYKVAHHGSRYSNSADFLAAVAPEYCVIQCGRDNQFGHPHKPALDRMEKVCKNILRTDQDGTIYAWADGSICTVFTTALTAEEHTEAIHDATSYETDGIPLIYSEDRGRPALVVDGNFNFEKFYVNEPSPLAFTLRPSDDTETNDSRKIYNISIYEGKSETGNLIGTLEQISANGNASIHCAVPWTPAKEGHNEFLVKVESDDKNIGTAVVPIEVKRRRLLIDTKHGNWFVLSGKTSSWISDLKKSGYRVTYPSKNEITSIDLAQADALLIVAPEEKFTEEELALLLSFSNQGKGILLTSGNRESSEEIVKTIADTLSVPFVFDNSLLATTDNLPDKDTSLANCSTELTDHHISVLFPEKLDNAPILFYSAKGIKGSSDQRKLVPLAVIDDKIVTATINGSPGTIVLSGGLSLTNKGYELPEKFANETGTFNLNLIHYISGRAQNIVGLKKQRSREENFQSLKY
jgi:beta-lactamase superfamily II metal-dependent hydrolase